uniref:Uncharacterized conserved protein, DUF497 family n=1 Tax=Candidatus Kentrum sp. FM TaxID=2126340 RepID=A0A450VL61_9GAMM|nr:MAG: Uncharacterized conserved protein, DUF497 family [Candidatus Kentron sp. FM]VFJ43390.1 MAG: Uncharacterized conserved protein, DUF497 family [Candidatus Kentron sp. FM]VFK05529.1 MAG: Uncharacterized conserved protein, DUF497 family [Candidatus Kentron sp. FM]
MPFEITRIVWLDDIVEKLHWKHHVDETEVIEVFENRPRFRRKETGLVPGEDVYAAFGRTNQNRLLSVFFVYTKDKRAIIVSARDMTEKESRKYVG